MELTLHTLYLCVLCGQSAFGALVEVQAQGPPAMQQVWYQQLLAATWADLIRVVALPWSKAHDAELIQLCQLRPLSGYKCGADGTAPPRARVVVLSCDEERRRYPVKHNVPMSCSVCVLASRLQFVLLVMLAAHS